MPNRSWSLIGAVLEAPGEILASLSKICTKVRRAQKRKLSSPLGPKESQNGYLGHLFRICVAFLFEEKIESFFIAFGTDFGLLLKHKS